MIQIGDYQIDPNNPLHLGALIAGAVALLVAHVASGVVRAETIAFSVAMIPPAFIGVQIGMSVMDRIDQQTFRRATLFVLLIAGLNLVRRALMG